MGLKFNGTPHLLVCINDLNLLVDNIDTIIKKHVNLIAASKGFCLRVNTEKTMSYILLSRHQNEE
jgi:hypothetical protein